MMHNISKLKHITDKQAGKYTELEYVRMTIFESLEYEKIKYESKRNNNND